MTNDYKDITNLFILVYHLLVLPSFTIVTYVYQSLSNIPLYAPLFLGNPIGVVGDYNL